MSRLQVLLVTLIDLGSLHEADTTLFENLQSVDHLPQCEVPRSEISSYGVIKGTP